MKINETWSVEGGNGDFILTQTVEGTNKKTGEPVERKTQTYHATLEQVAAKIARTHALEAVEEENLQKVVDAVEKLSENILNLINKTN